MFFQIIRHYLSKWSHAQFIRLCNIGTRLFPFSVKEYSTRGGISGNNFRLIRLSSSNIFKLDVSTFGDISGIARPIWLNRVVSFSASMHNINIDHLPEKREITFLTGQASIFVYFCKFSFISKLFIFNISYLRVSAYALGNLLFLCNLYHIFALSNRKRVTSAKLVNIFQHIKLWVK